MFLISRRSNSHLHFLWPRRVTTSAEDSMAARHKFAVGDPVQLVARLTDTVTPLGVYTVVRQLPGDEWERSYHVKNNRDGHERVVPESQLETAGALLTTAQAVSSRSSTPSRRQEKPRSLSKSGHRRRE